MTIVENFASKTFPPGFWILDLGPGEIEVKIISRGEIADLGFKDVAKSEGQRGRGQKSGSNSLQSKVASLGIKQRLYHSEGIQQ